LQPIASQTEGAPTRAFRIEVCAALGGSNWRRGCWSEKAAQGIMQRRGGLESRPFSFPTPHIVLFFLCHTLLDDRQGFQVLPSSRYEPQPRPFPRRITLDVWLALRDLDCLDLDCLKVAARVCCFLSAAAAIAASRAVQSCALRR
jgi:hypothetical protein